MSKSGSDKPDKKPDNKPDTKPRNKPDFKKLNLGSPISTLPSRATGPGPTTSSSSSSSGSVSSRSRRPEPGQKSKHSGDLSGSVSSSPRGGLKSPVSQSRNVTLPIAGNICPLGGVKTGMASKSVKTDVLGSGKVNYGHGSIMRGTGSGGPTAPARDAEDCMRLGNEKYKLGLYSEAVEWYDRALWTSPKNTIYRFNKAMALTGLMRFVDAVREFEEVIRLDNGYVKAHLRLGSLFIRLGQVENARRHLCFPGINPDPSELNKLQAVDTKLNKCTNSRKVGEWKSVLREVDAVIAAGADSSPQLFACKAEAFLKLHQLEEATLSLSNVPESEESTPSISQSKFFGIPSVPYLLFVRAQFEMAFGRFENAVSLAEKALKMDPRNIEVSVLVNNVRLASKYRTGGNDLFKAGRYTEACTAYSEGLKIDPSNSILYCNRAACWYKLGQWEHSLDDCNKALRIHPKYTKALLRRAASSTKLERWSEAVRDYEALKKELPQDNEVAESLFYSQVALRKSRGEDISNLKFGGEVEFVLGLNQFKAAISVPGVSVVLFKTANNIECRQITPFLDTLCRRYPIINFFKVEIDQSPAITRAENVRIVPTFKIYRNGVRVKVMVCPSEEVLESSVRHYSL